MEDIAVYGSESIDAKLDYYIDYFSNKSNKFGEWIKEDDKFPYLNYSVDTINFIDFAYDDGLTINFDWTKWDEMESFLSNASLIESQNKITLQKLLTSIIRTDRFCEGTLLNAIDDGLILNILLRLKSLDNEEESIQEPVEYKNLLYFKSSYIKGFGFYDGIEILDKLTVGTKVTMILDSDNEYDEYAIQVNVDDKKIGFISKDINKEIALILRAEQNIFDAFIDEYNQNERDDRRIKVAIYIKDKKA